MLSMMKKQSTAPDDSKLYKKLASQKDTALTGVESQTSTLNTLKMTCLEKRYSKEDSADACTKYR